MNRKRVVVAMSGGVDSSVAALLLRDAGWDVVGFTMQLFGKKDACGLQKRTCCAPEDIVDARHVAAKLGIPHYVINLEETFQEHIVAYFVREYVSGRTPNPCILCNSILKFHYLLDKALAIGATHLATGHYAMISDEDKVRKLRRARDREKDQSYFLYNMTQPMLEKVMFPLAELTKPEVRALALGKGIPTAEKGDSQEICFGDTEGYYPIVLSRHPELPTTGEIRGLDGQLLGYHQGYWRYTIGQRRGLGQGFGQKMYVAQIIPETNHIVIGPEEALQSRRLVADGVTWIDGPPSESMMGVEAQIRYRHKAVPARLILMGGDRVEVAFDNPVKAITPGQAVVFYHGDSVLGGGWIREAMKEHP